MHSWNERDIGTKLQCKNNNIVNDISAMFHLPGLACNVTTRKCITVWVKQHWLRYLAAETCSEDRPFACCRMCDVDADDRCLQCVNECWDMFDLVQLKLLEAATKLTTIVTRITINWRHNALVKRTELWSKSARVRSVFTEKKNTSVTMAHSMSAGAFCRLLALLV